MRDIKGEDLSNLYEELGNEKFNEGVEKAISIIGKHFSHDWDKEECLSVLITELKAVKK